MQQLMDRAGWEEDMGEEDMGECATDYTCMCLGNNWDAFMLVCGDQIHNKLSVYLNKNCTEI